MKPILGNFWWKSLNFETFTKKFSQEINQNSQKHILSLKIKTTALLLTYLAEFTKFD